MENITVDNDTLYNTIIIKNINDYNLQFLNNDLIITRQTIDTQLYITYDELMKKNLRNSEIIDVKINNQSISNMTKYAQLIKYIYTQLDKSTIMTNTIISVSREEKNDKGFVYYPDIGLSIRGVDAKTALKEIINQITKSSQTLEIKIKLKSEEIINFSS
jgi:hypothetical protein